MEERVACAGREGCLRHVPSLRRASNTTHAPGPQALASSKFLGSASGLFTIGREMPCDHPRSGLHPPVVYLLYIVPVSRIPTRDGDAEATHAAGD